MLKAEPVIDLSMFDAAPDETARCSFMELDDSKCKWPHGEPGTEGFFFCGAASIGTFPYCGFHSRVAYQPAPDRRLNKPLAPVFVGSMERRWATA